MVRAAYSSGDPGDPGSARATCPPWSPTPTRRRRPPRWSRARPSTTASSAAPRTTWSSTARSPRRSGPRWRRPGRRCALPRRRPGWPPAFDPADGHLRREVLGQSASAIAEAAGVRREGAVRVLVLPLDLDQVDGPLGRGWPRCCRCSPWRDRPRSAGVPAAAGPAGHSHTAVITTGDERGSGSPRRSRPAGSWSTARPPTAASGSATA